MASIPVSMGANRSPIVRRWDAGPVDCASLSSRKDFGHPQSLAASDALVREAAERFRGLGASVETVSIPMHQLGPAIWLPVAAEGATVQMMLGNGFGFNWQGLYVTSMIDFHSQWRTRADELSDTLKNTMLLGHYMVKHHRGHYYGKAQNLVRRLRAAYTPCLPRMIFC